MRTVRPSLRSALVVAASTARVLALASCAPGGRATPAATPTSEDACADITTVKDGTITVGTSDPAFPPYVIDNDPTNGKGFESAVAYAVAEEMGFTDDQVEWTFAGFNKLFAPGEKDYDFALNQISITPEREQAVTFSDPYYEAANAILVLKDSEFADATTLAEFQDAKIGVQVGTTALDAGREPDRTDAGRRCVRRHHGVDTGAEERRRSTPSSPTCRRRSTSPPSRCLETVVGQMPAGRGGRHLGPGAGEGQPSGQLRQPGTRRAAASPVTC